MSDGSLKPRPIGNPSASLPVGKATVSGSVSEVKGQPKEVIPEQNVQESLEPQYVTPLVFPRLLVPMRNVIATSTMLDDLLEYLKVHTKGKLVDIVETGLEHDPKFSAFVDRKAEEFSDRGSNLLIETLALLKISTNFRIKAFLTAVGLVTNEDILINDFIVPSLDQRSYFENAGNNNNFVRMLLKQLPREDLVRIFAMVKFDGINNNDNFAKSIAVLPDEHVEKVLNALMDVSVGEGPKNAKIEGVDGYVHVEGKERIQTLLLITLEKLKKDKRKLPKEPLERLYRACDEAKLSDRAIALINSSDEIDANLFLLESILDESKKEDSYERVRRFWAIDDYASKVGTPVAAAGLKRVILECETPIVVNYATYKLANSCDEEGKAALIDAIKQKIRINEPSLPLAFVVSHIDLIEDSFGDIFFRLLDSEFIPTARDISSGFDRISNVKVARAERNKDNGTTFSHDSELLPATPITVFEKIGIIPLINRIVVEQADQREQNETLSSNTNNHYESNLVGLIYNAFCRHEHEMRALMSAALSQSKRTKPKIYAYLLSLGGTSIAALQPINILNELQNFFPDKKIE